MKPGRRCIDWPRAVCWAASAWVVVFRCWTRPLRSDWRWAMSETRLPDLTMKLVNLPVSRLSSRNSTLVEATAGLRYCQAAWAFLPAFAYCDADPWITF